MSPSYKIAVIQLYSRPLRPADNFAKAVKFIQDAATQGCDLAVLPEFHLTSWVPTDPRFTSVCADWEEYLKRYQALARECNICIVPGSLVRPTPASPNDTTDPGLENVTYFISSTGEILGSYVKKNLWGLTERPFLQSSGDSPHQIISTPLGPVGLLICWDIAFPEAFRELVYQGARVIIAPTFLTEGAVSKAGHDQNPSAAALFIDSIVTARAHENACAIVFANAGGPPGTHYCGLSQVTVPFKGPIVRLCTSSERMGVATLDMGVLDTAEQNFFVRTDLTDPNWHYRHTLRKMDDSVAKL